MIKGKKPLSWCWKYFNRKVENDGNGKSIITGYCKFCNAPYKKDTARMEKHLEKCLKVGGEAGKEIDRLLKKPASGRSRSQSPKSKKLKLLQSADVSSQSVSRPLRHFFNSTSKDEQEELDIALTRAFATGNIAPNFLNNPFFNSL